MSGPAEPSRDPGAEGATAAPGGTGVPAAPVGWLPRAAEEIFGAGATAAEAYALLTVDVPADGWIAALQAARDELGCTYFDWLSAVDEPGTGFRVCAHLAALPSRTGGEPGVLHRLVVRTTVPHEAPVLPTATGVYAGAGWHERETHEMFGVDFAGHPHLVPLLLPEEFEGHPLRKDFVLAARVAKAWPGAKEPGESGHGGPKRRQTQPPGVPDPNEWGPLKGQLPPAPSRPARGRGARAGAGAGDRPARRTRTAAEGSAGQRQPPPSGKEGTSAGGAGAESEAPEAPARQPDKGEATVTGGASGAGEVPRDRAAPGPRTDDAPWHRERPASADGTAGRDQAPHGNRDEEPDRDRDQDQDEGEGDGRTGGGT